MLDFLKNLLESDFMPHGSCYYWAPEILWLHAGSDLLIALSYYSIPAALFYFVKKREDLDFSWIFILFGAFILACGTTHLMSLWTTWNATYRLEGVLKLVTALVSLLTAILLWPLIPKALALPSPGQLAESNRALQAEMRDRQAAEQQARIHLEQLAHVDRINTMGEMATTLGHELHQPLGAILNFARGCERSLESGADPAEMKEILRKISRQAERAAEIVRRTRAFSSLREMHRQPVDVNHVICEVADLLDALLRENEVEVVFDTAPDLPVVLLDRVQIQQVMVNLVKNGIESMGDVPPAERRLQIRSRLSGEDMIELTFSDHGCGAEVADLDQLFDSFYTTKESGMGMGLGISRSIVEAHGGQLKASRNDDIGLTFHVVIPLTSAAEQDEYIAKLQE